ncbi:MAG TPA: hypothetical protein VG328_23310 [Stellaceae bacterium]|jgi:hypothetical protein|nr:hypothetical protein [Stellaceae bacterium]
MEILPQCRAAQFAQVEPGSLCFMLHPEGQCADFIVHDPTAGDKLHLPLGPAFPQDMRWPTLVGWGEMKLLSFGKEFDVLLPNSEAGWSFVEPSRETICLLLADDKLYLRANFLPHPNDFRACFVDLETGNVFCAGGQYARPPGTAVFAIDWAFVTCEERPRTIFSAAPRA